MCVFYCVAGIGTYLRSHTQPTQNNNSLIKDQQFLDNRKDCIKTRVCLLGCGRVCICFCFQKVNTKLRRVPNDKQTSKYVRRTYFNKDHAL